MKKPVNVNWDRIHVACWVKDELSPYYGTAHKFIQAANAVIRHHENKDSGMPVTLTKAQQNAYYTAAQTAGRLWHKKMKARVK